MPAPHSRPARAFLVAAALVPGAAGLLALAAHATLFARRAGFPLDLEWMEGGMLLHATRLAAGQTVYPPPSLDFIPFLYTPLYPKLLALLGNVAGVGYLQGRLVSIAAYTGALILLVVCAAREAPRLWAIPIGIAAAGAVTAGYAFSGSFYDIVRGDSLLLLLEAAALALALWEERVAGPRDLIRAALAGLAIALAFFTKQTAAVPGIALGLGLLGWRWRRGLIYGATAAVTLALGVLLLDAGSHGWFWTYIFKLHQSHSFNAHRAYLETPLRLFGFGAPLYLALLGAALGLGLAGRLQRRDLVHGAVALGGFIAACVGFGTQWAFDNAFIPALYFPAFTAALFAARLFNQTAREARPGLRVCTAVAALGFTVAAAKTALPARHFAPQRRDREAAARFLEGLRTDAAAGPLFIPFHPFYNVLVGSPAHAHRMGVLDVGALLGRPAGLDEAIAQQRFAYVVLDWKSQPWEWPGLESHYHEIHRFTDGVDAVRSFSGAETSPRRLLARTLAPPTLAPTALRIADFENGWAGFAPEGDAWGPTPAPAAAGLYGRAAADSRAAGPAATGALRSPPLLLEHPHLRFTLAGDFDPGLRVLLLDGPEAVRSVVPTGGGRAQSVDWDVRALIGHTVTLVIEDRSTRGGLAVDEIVAD